MHPQFERLQLLTRRHFLKAGSLSIGAIGLSSLLADATPSDPQVNSLAQHGPHFTPKAKRVIYLHLTGSPPHLDMYDYKPELVKFNGKECPDQFTKGKRFAFTSGTPKLMGTPRKFCQYGKGGVWLSDAVPNF